MHRTVRLVPPKFRQRRGRREESVGSSVFVRQEIAVVTELCRERCATFNVQRSMRIDHSCAGEDLPGDVGSVVDDVVVRKSVAVIVGRIENGMIPVRLETARIDIRSRPRTIPADEDLRARRCVRTNRRRRNDELNVGCICLIRLPAIDASSAHGHGVDIRWTRKGSLKNCRIGRDDLFGVLFAELAVGELRRLDGADDRDREERDDRHDADTHNEERHQHFGERRPRTSRL